VTCAALDAAVGTASALLAPLGEQVVPGGRLGPLTTYRVGGRAALLVTATGVPDLDLLRVAVRASGLPVLVIGRGSNLLVADSGFAGIGVLLDPSRFGEVRINRPPDGSGHPDRPVDPNVTVVRAGGAVPLPALARQTVEAGLTGLEWAVGVPGSVGGAVRMNAGGHGSDIAHSLRACEVVDIGGDGPSELIRMSSPDLRFGYRTSTIHTAHVVLAAEFEVRPGDRTTGRTMIRDIVRWRRQHQPGGQNAGSVFTNPPGEPPANSAGWLIETAGCKGRRVGSAMVSPKHANFIQADDRGSADDVRRLMDVVRHEVQRVHGIDLHPEVRMVGFPEASTTDREVSTSSGESTASGEPG
jgi:UDP-N-acetylmuramate dehydrogenase